MIDTRLKSAHLRKCHAQEKSVLKRLRASNLGRLFLVNLAPKDISEYRDLRVADGAKPATVNREISLISHICSVAAQDWGLHLPSGNPVRLVRRPKIHNQRDRRLESGEERRLLEACAQPLRSIVLIALETAMRRGEIAALRWENIDFAKRTAHLPETKNGSARNVPLSSVAIQVLKSLPRLNRPGFRGGSLV